MPSASERSGFGSSTNGISLAAIPASTPESWPISVPGCSTAPASTTPSVSAMVLTSVRPIRPPAPTTIRRRSGMNRSPGRGYDRGDPRVKVPATDFQIGQAISRLRPPGKRRAACRMGHAQPQETQNLPVLDTKSLGRRRLFAMAGVGLRYRHIVIFVSGIFLVSNALIVPGLRPAAGLLVVAGCAASLLSLTTIRSRADGLLAQPVEPSVLALCSFVAVALCVLGGEGHFFFANYDWLTRDAVLADLVRQSFPVLFDYQGSEFFLRAPLGMYMIPSAVGKLLGLRSAHLALLAQNATILALTLTLLMALVPRRKAVFLVAFIGFSGIEIVGAFINAGFKLAAFGTFTWPVHMHQHLAMWNPFFEYTNHITQIFWVPNHALPGWWLAALCVLHVRREVDSAVLVLSFAFLLFWSPLAMVGALPIVTYLVLRRDFAGLPDPRLLAAGLVALCFIPIVIYLEADAGSVPHEWRVLKDGFWIIYPLFIMVQIPHAAIVAWFWQRLDHGAKTLALLSIGLLLVIPTYSVGLNNDFAMRASIVPLALLAFVFGSIVAELQFSDGIKRISAPIAIVVLG